MDRRQMGIGLGIGIAAVIAITTGVFLVVKRRLRSDRTVQGSGDPTGCNRTERETQDTAVRCSPGHENGDMQECSRPIRESRATMEYTKPELSAESAAKTTYVKPELPGESAHKTLPSKAADQNSNHQAEIVAEQTRLDESGTTGPCYELPGSFHGHEVG
jgi:hypothetical protein